MWCVFPSVSHEQWMSVYGTYDTALLIYPLLIKGNKYISFQQFSFFIFAFVMLGWGSGVLVLFIEKKNEQKRDK